jgi:hypothetical protein
MTLICTRPYYMSRYVFSFMFIVIKQLLTGFQAPLSMGKRFYMASLADISLALYTNTAFVLFVTLNTVVQWWRNALAAPIPLMLIETRFQSTVEHQ